ncbi:heavy metal sensor histidine kinase [Vibrio alginolyticus]|uniref:heavy metal sensor histidine kinase n=1 Tax=Vibrio alginolyticus TaxID=663 RepID=UPI001BD67C87|nr:heavy metal sensor histidine kinase [Vibrio alginolyticus]MBS9869641.1 heavy metal sensor histidine kinase [Vibrio alginolyticus]
MFKFPLPFSMKNRLVLMFIGMTFVTYFSLAFILQYAIERHFYTQDFNYISSKFNAIDKNLKKSPESVFEQSNSTPLYMWVFEGENILYKNSRLTIPNVRAYTLSSPRTLNNDRAIEWSEDSLNIRAFAFKAGDYVVVLGISINHHFLFLEKLNWILFWLLGFAFLVSSVFSSFIVKRGLQPIVRLNKHIQQVSPEQMGIRIDPDSLPTELRDLANKHNAMLDRLQMGFRRLSEFSSDIAHELKTPLTNITTQNQVILGACRSPEEYQDAIASTLEEIYRITKTINDLLYIAKAENKLIHRNDEVFAVHEELARLVEYFEILADDAEVQIVSSGKGLIYMDKNMFERAVGNLLSNAIRHAYPHSTIVIQVREVGQHLTISVSNQGDEIPKQSLPYIFDRFYRADKSRQNLGSIGAGLGLSITQSIVHAYDGEINVKSKGQQTTFQITLCSAN